MWTAVPAALLVLAAAAAWAVAPALSERPYVPDPVEFEVHGGQSAGTTSEARAWRATTGGGAVLSRTVRTPRRFNLVGLRWRGAGARSIHIRIHRAGGGWGRWTTVPADPDHSPDPGAPERAAGWRTSDPVWAGQADRVRYRLRARGAVRSLRLHFVNTTGTATPLDRLRTGLRRVVSGAVAAAASFVGARPAAAVTALPPIVTRDQWGAAKCPPRADPYYGEVKAAFVHHTVTATDYGPQDSAAMVLAICRYHRNSNGWNDIGYNFLADRYGTIFEGRAGGVDRAVSGAQAQGYNSQSTSVANLGTFSTQGQTEEALQAVARLLAWKLSLHGVPVTGKVTLVSGGGPLNRYSAGTRVVLERISGHRDADATSCPGDGLQRQLPQLRMLTAAVPGATVTGLSLGALRSHITFGEKADLEGRLTDPQGQPLAGRGVEVLGRGRHRWTLLREVQTDAAGAFGARVRLSFNRAVRARFKGGTGTASARSPVLEVGVRPLVSAALAPGGAGAAGAIRAGARVTLRGTVRPRKRGALLLVDRLTASGFHRVARRPASARGGQLLASYRLARPGSYRLRFAVLADGRNLGARSEGVEVNVRG